MTRYTLPQLLACLHAAEYRWQHADWHEAGAAKHAVFALRDRVRMLAKVLP